MLLIDDRIGSNDLLPTMRALGLPCDLARLEFGDVAFCGKGADGVPVQVALELKRLDDILACIVTGRFSGHQLPGLVQNFDEIYLVIEGIYRPNPKDGVLESRQGREWKPLTIGNRPWMFRDLEAFLTTIEVRGGVRLRRTSDRQETARVVAHIYRWWDTDFKDHTSHIAVNRSRDMALFTKPSLRFSVASVLPGLGIMRAGCAAGHFKTVQEMVMASEKDWLQVPGIGKLTAQKIVEGMTSESA